MNVKSVVENKEKFEVELTIEVGQEEFEAGLDKAYRKNRGSISVPGFRKGKAPRKVIEGMYGAGVFYEDAIEEIYPQACMQAIEEKGLDSVAPPRVEITDLGKEGFTFKAIVTVRPVITLKQYKGLEADKVLPTVTDAAVDNELKQYVDRATQLEPVDRAAEMGDSMVMDYEGVKDGVPFEGGSAKGYELALGSHTFIPGFEDQIVGHSVGDAFDVRVTFPADYHVSELCGKEAVFAVKLKAIQSIELPALDDDFAKDVSEFDTMDAYKADIKVKIEKRHENAAESVFEETVVNALNEKLGGEAIPAAMIDAEVENVVRDYDNRLRMQGLDLNSYLKYTNNSLEQFRSQVRPQAESYVKTRLALEKIAELENITVSDEELEAEYARVAEKYGMEVDKVKPLIPADSLITDLKVKKAMDLVKANTVAPTAKPADAE
mgnify:CR=1 FL=1